MNNIEYKKLIEIIGEISSSKKKFVNIAKKYAVDEKLISEINIGSKYKVDFIEYPVRNKQYSIDLLKQIRFSLKYETDLSFSEVAKKYDIKQRDLNLINNGRIYFVNGEDYPLRKGNKAVVYEKRNGKREFVDINTVRQIHNLLKKKVSISKISELFCISTTTVKNINSGIEKRYRIDGVSYPIMDTRRI